MADTIVNTPGPSSNDGDGAAGWLVALIIIVLIIVGGAILYKKGFFNGSRGGDTNINVTVPNPANTNGGNTGGTSSGTGGGTDTTPNPAP